MDYKFEFLFVGGGILGSSCSMSLAKGLEAIGRPVNIGVIDLDLEGEHSSTLKNAGGVRATWRNRANIELCKYSIDHYRAIREEIQFWELGYYWMHDEESWLEINKNYPLYMEYGLNVELYPADEIPMLLPFVDNLSGISGLSVSRKAGLIDHYSLREHYRKEARKSGVQFIDGMYVKDIVVKDDIVTEVKAYDLRKFSEAGTGSARVVKEILTKGFHPPYQDLTTIACETLINTSGAWSPTISALYGFSDDKVKPRRRQMVLIASRDVDLADYGMIIDTSDIYFHKEGENILAGYSNMDEPYGYNFEFSFGGIDETGQFVKFIWEPLSRRVSKFENLKLIKGWAGVYAETPDRSGYLGRVGRLKNVYECVAHTGRGLMISHGAGVALADLILKSEFRPELRSAKALARERPSGELYEELHL